MRQALFTDVAHHFQTAIGKRSEIAYQIGPPVTAAYNSNFNLLCHITTLVCSFPDSDALDVPHAQLPQKQVCARDTMEQDDFWEESFLSELNVKAFFPGDALPILELLKPEGSAIIFL